MARGHRHHHHRYGYRDDCYEENCKKAAYCQQQHALTEGSAGSFQISSDGRSWHEYHGIGSICYESGHNHPVGGVHFDDNTARGYHSHAVHFVDPNNPGNATRGWSRPEGENLYDKYNR